MILSLTTVALPLLCGGSLSTNLHESARTEIRGNALSSAGEGAANRAWGAVLRTAAELNDFHEHAQACARPFEIEGTIRRCFGNVIFQDATAYTWINRISPEPQEGDCVRLAGVASFRKPFEAEIVATSAVVIGKSPARPPVDVSLARIDDRAFNYADVRTEGVFIDMLEDEADPRYVLMILKDGAARIPVSLSRTRFPKAAALVNARVRVVGTLFRALRGMRKYAGPLITADRIEVLAPPPADPFAAPPLTCVWYSLTPNEIAAMDRHTVSGDVLATWDESQLLVRDGAGGKVNVRLSPRTALPLPGARVEIVGYPQTDLYRINLVHARWRPAAPAGAAVSPREEQPVDLSAADILLDSNGCRRVCSDYHGERIRLRGTVRSVPLWGSPEKRLYLDSGPIVVPVDCSQSPQAADGVQIGSEVEITGHCIIQFANRVGHGIFPQATGFMLVLRSPADIRVLRKPPWLTPARFALILALTLTVLAAILVWNVTLRILVNRRCGELLRAQSRTVAATLRTEERTRLAVELHDTLAQNLTGVSMEIETAARCADEGLEPVLRHLRVADRALKFCRNELRNTLWDLRNQSLETASLDVAIRRTLLPHVKGVDLAVRFDVARTRFTDTTLHELLRIIRELVLNGIRHGHATRIRIAGSVADGALLVSVRDNGCGFDPAAAPGMADGHFGLHGVRERLSALAGRLTLESSPGKGTYARLSIPLPRTRLQGIAHAPDNHPAR